MDEIKDYQYKYVLIVFDDIDVDHYWSLHLFTLRGDKRNMYVA